MIKVLYAVLGIMLGAGALKVYQVVSDSVITARNAQTSAELADTYSKMVDRCLTVLGTCRVVTEQQNEKYEMMASQYDKLAQACYTNNPKYKPQPKLANYGQGRGQGGPDFPVDAGQ